MVYQRGDRNELAIRVPLTQIREIAPETAQMIVLERAQKAFPSLADAVERLVLSGEQLENLARSGALAVFGSRRNVLWKVRATLRDKFSHGKLSHGKFSHAKVGDATAGNDQLN